MINAVVIRRSSDEDTVAIVSCDVSESVKSAGDLWKALKRAVVAWGRASDAGRAVLQACPDFNVGDCGGPLALARGQGT